MRSFEFDERKSKANLEKHGNDFIDTQALWDDPYLIEIPAKTQDESRYLVIGRIAGKYWSTIYTPREGSVRIISVHRSRKEEVALER